MKNKIFIYQKQTKVKWLSKQIENKVKKKGEENPRDPNLDFVRMCHKFEIEHTNELYNTI